MRKQLLMLTFVLTLCNILYAWQTGDAVDSLVFTDVDFSGSDPVFTERSINELTGEGKAVIIYYENISYS